MGCSSSSEETNVKKSTRRRLSVSSPGNEEINDDEVVEQDRGLITDLDKESVIQILAANNQMEGGRKMSIGSNTDHQKEGFKNKTMQQFGDKIETDESGIGYTCRKGLKPESPNQDSWFVLKTSHKSMYAVFDGHGQKGHDVSNFVKENLPKIILKHASFSLDNADAIATMMRDSFKKMQSLVATMDRTKQLSAQLSGTTATVVIHDTTNKKLHLAHVADSTAVVGKKNPNGQKGAYVGQKLTRDHKPELTDERRRIEKSGGRVVFDGYANHRVYVKTNRYPGLNMSRCLGDLMGHKDCGLSCEPETSCYSIKDEDEVLLVCSDGVWEFIDPSTAVSIVAAFEPQKAVEAAEVLAKKAWDAWIKEEGGNVVDDITVVLVYLKHQRN